MADYTDDLGRKVEDVTEYYQRHYGERVVKAERCGANILVLYDEDEEYQLSYRWLTHETATLVDILGSEFVHLARDDVDPNKPLFEQFRLFP